MTDRNAPMRLKVAAELAFPFGGMTPRDLLKEADAGRLKVTRTVDRVIYVTLAAIDEMRELCRTRVDPNSLPPECVYFVRCGEFVKIGWTSDLRKRTASMPTDNPFEFVLLHTVVGNRKVERNFHSQFDHLRHRGEWFRYEGDLRDWLEATQ